jgi:hypothetical protein
MMTDLSVRFRLLIFTLFLGACATATPSEGSFRFVEDSTGGALVIFEGSAPVLAYRYGDQCPEGIPLDRTRSSYLHPIWGLDGEILTDDFPADHHHHRGLSWMWPRMKVGEREVELWHIRGIRDRFVEWIERDSDERGARLVIGNEWILDDGTIAAHERVRIEVHPATERGRAIDIEIGIEVLDEPIVLQGQVDKGYGGLNLRFAPREDTVLFTDTGRQESDSDRQRFAWGDLSARFEGREEPSGIAILVHPDHPDAPVPWTLRHYGDSNAAWPGVDAVLLEPGELLTLTYRLWVHRGAAPAGEVEAAWRSYVEDR